jgi:hypothetical protein
MSEDPKGKVGVINLGQKELSPEEESGYREKIKAAKAGSPISAFKGSTPVGVEQKVQMPVLQNSRRDSVEAPQAPGVVPRPPGSPTIRPETQEQLAAAIKAGQTQEQEAVDKKALDEKKLADEARMAQLFDSFDFGDASRNVERILDNKKRQKEIEGRCAAMNFEDLLLHDEVKQTVPIIPGKFEPTFRSITPVESLYIKQRMSKETTQTDQFLGEKYNLLLLTCSILDINGAGFPDHRKHHGDGTFSIEDRLFDDKLAALTRKSGYVIADLGINYFWFDIRVRRLLNPDDLKNG